MHYKANSRFCEITLTFDSDKQVKAWRKFVPEYRLKPPTRIHATGQYEMAYYFASAEELSTCISLFEQFKEQHFTVTIRDERPPLVQPPPAPPKPRVGNAQIAFHNIEEFNQWYVDNPHFWYASFYIEKFKNNPVLTVTMKNVPETIKETLQKREVKVMKRCKHYNFYAH